MFIFVKKIFPKRTKPIPPNRASSAQAGYKTFETMNEAMKFCQSCGMPLQAAGDFGTESGGRPSADYCVYCYKNGIFTEECTMEEMIQHCAQFHEEFRDENGKSYTREEVVRLRREYFPTLRRWSK